MTLRIQVALIIVWLASIGVVATLAGAQARPSVPVPTPTVLSGADVGFRVEARQGNTPVGRLVVRVNGQWVDAAFTTGTSSIELR